ncbi:MAG: hypothetical protein WBE20_11725 [Candidatus Acidiferrales bacterium]
MKSSHGHQHFFPCVLPLLALLLFSYPVLSRQSASGGRIRLVPHFVAGQVLRYGVQMGLDTESQSTGPVIDPEAAKKLTESVNVTLRLDVLSVSASAATLGQARIRATYEKAAATSSSDSYDPDAAAVSEQFRKLDGQSMEFTLQPDGKITGATGLKDVVSDPSRAAVISQWLSQLTLGASLPQKGIAIGEKWSSEQPLENMPLARLSWRTSSSYLRNESCHAPGNQAAGPGAAPPEPSADDCAMILTKSEIVSSGSDKDRTPDVFRQNGLRTSGKWTGAGEGLTSISLRTGMVVSVTQTSTTQMDFTIMTATTERNRMRYAGSTHSQSEITLLSQSTIP